ncbi:MAG: STAS domain-containing protein [Sphingomicrobium sp.]
MKVAFVEVGELLIARPQGRVEAGDGAELALSIGQRLRPNTKSVTVDLGQLEFVNFGGIRAILRLARSLKGQQRSIDFLNGNHAVRDALDQAGLDDFFPFLPPYISTRGTPK